MSDDGQVLAAPGPHDEVQPREHRLGHARGVVDEGRAELLREDVGHLEADRRRVAVAREVDEAGHEAAVAVAAHEQPGLAALLHVQDREGHLGELLGVDLEQLVARVGLEDLQQVLVGVAVDAEAGPVEHLLRDAAGERHVHDGRDVGARGVEAEEAALADDLAVGVEHLHADVVEVGGAVHGGAGVGLGEHHDVRVARLGADLGREGDVALRHLAVVAQDAEPGAGDRLEVGAVVAERRTRGSRGT